MKPEGKNEIGADVCNCVKREERCQAKDIRSGFTAEADAYCREKGIACSEDEKWLETGKLKSPVV